MAERIRVMVVKSNEYAAMQAALFQALGGSLGMDFTSTTTEDAAIQAFKNDQTDFIVSGYQDINWRKLLHEVGPDRMLVYSAYSDVETRSAVESAGVSYVVLNGTEGMSAVILNILGRFPRE